MNFFLYSLTRTRNFHVQILLLIRSEFKQFNQLLFPNKSSEKHRFSDDLRGYRSQLIRLILLNPLQASVAFLYPLKTSENLKVFRYFQGV